MLCEVGDEISPFVPILGRRNDRPIPKRLHHLRRGKFLGHEAEFHKRADAVLQQAVVNLVDIGKIIERLSLEILVVQAKFIVKDGMEAYVFKSSSVFDGAKVAAIAFAKRQTGATGTEHAFPIVRKSVADGMCIDDYGFCGEWRFGRALRLRYLQGKGRSNPNDNLKHVRRFTTAAY